MMMAASKRRTQEFLMSVSPFDILLMPAKRRTCLLRCIPRPDLLDLPPMVTTLALVA
jgi:hypothetical protein